MLDQILFEINKRKQVNQGKEVENLMFSHTSFEGVPELKNNLLDCLRLIDDSIIQVSDLYVLSDKIKHIIEEFLNVVASHIVAWTGVAYEFDEVVKENDKKWFFKVLSSNEIKRRQKLISEVKPVLQNWRLEGEMFESLLDKLPILIERVKGEIEERISNE